MKRAICPGTFDPITNGHIDIIKRAALIFGSITVAVVKNPSKNTLFSYQERFDLAQATLRGVPGISVEGFDGLVVDYARKKKVRVIVRGIRMISDFEYEFQMALTNRNLASSIETIFFMPHPQYSFISSRLIKEAATLGANLKQFLPGIVARALRNKIHESRGRKNNR